MGVIGDGVELLKLVNKVQNMDLYERLGRWVDKVTALEKEVEQLKEERDQLREQILFKGLLERINGHTFAEGDDDEICPKCAEVDRIPVHLIPHHAGRPPGQKAYCPRCALEFQHNVPYSRQVAIGRAIVPRVL